MLIEVDKLDPERAAKLATIDDFLKNKKAFVLFYWDSCGPCQATLPEWNKLNNTLRDLGDDVAIVKVEQAALENNALPNILKAVESFPTIRFYHDGKFEDYSSYREQKGLEDAGRTVDDFVAWIQDKLGDTSVAKAGGRRVRRSTRKRKGPRSRREKNMQHLIQAVLGLLGGLFLGATGVNPSGIILVILDALHIGDYKSNLGAMQFLNLFPLTAGSVYEYYKEKKINYVLGGILVATMVLGTYLGALLVVGKGANQLSNKTIKLITAGIGFVMMVAFLYAAYYEKN